MLTIEQLPEETKERIIRILTDDGVTRESAQACAFGISAANLGILTMEESFVRLEEVAADRKKNNREYTIQVLTVYSNRVAEEMIDMTTLVYGAQSPEKLAEIRASGDKTIAEVIERHLPDLLEVYGSYIDDYPSETH